MATPNDPPTPPAPPLTPRSTAPLPAPTALPSTSGPETATPDVPRLPSATTPVEPGATIAPAPAPEASPISPSALAVAAVQADDPEEASLFEYVIVENPMATAQTLAGWRLMNRETGEEWRTLHAFELQEQQQVDYEVSNWYLATNPRSHFLSNLLAKLARSAIVARPDDGRRYALRNNQLSVHHRDGQSERHTLASVAELCAVLERDFRLKLPEDPALGNTLAPFVAHT